MVHAADESSFWRSVETAESRVPKRAPLCVREEARQEPAPEDWAAVRARVEAREEELYLVTSDSKFYARWCLQGFTPSNKAPEGVVLIPGHPEAAVDGQLEPMTMDSPLILALADELQAAGIPTLRFDYRGVGKSKGTFDTVAAVRELVSATSALCGASGASGPCASSVMVAVSFGAASSLGNIYTKGCKKFVSISHGLGFGSTTADGVEREPITSFPALRKLYNRTNIFFTTMRITIPKLWILGTHDKLTDKDELVTWLEHHSPGKGDLSTVALVPEARHDFLGHERRCATLVRSWLADPSAKPIVFHLDFASGPVEHMLE